MSGFLCRPKSKKQKEKRFPRNESPLPWHPGHVGLASIPPSPLILSLGKLSPLGSSVHHGHHGSSSIRHPRTVSFLRLFTSWDTEQFLLQIHYCQVFNQHSTATVTIQVIQQKEKDVFPLLAIPKMVLLVHISRYCTV